MDYPKFILKDIYWSFSEGRIDSIELFTEEVEQYYRSISGKKFPLKWDDIIFNFPAIELQYVKYIDDEPEEPYELVRADNGINFTVRELFYKTHKVGINLEDDDNCYFEGLMHSGDENEGVPIYFLITGS
ncbi:hypothetical protein [Myroides odoratus]|uniref:hypothetical protein n=1 Tax=Myroides odoratus TaxID=256 RepID=UPI0039B117C8